MIALRTPLVLGARIIVVALVVASGCQKKTTQTYAPGSTLSALQAIGEEVGTSATDVVTFARLYDEGPPAGETWKKHLSDDWTERCRVTRRLGALLVESSRHAELDPYRAQLDEPVKGVWAATEGLCDGVTPGPLPHSRAAAGQRRLKQALEVLSTKLKELAPPKDGGPRSS